MGKRLLIDADGVLYRAGFAVEKTEYLVTGKGEKGIGHTTVWDDCCKSAADIKEKVTPEALKEFGPLTVWSRKEIEPVENALRLCDLIIKDICDRYPEHKPDVWLSPSVGNFREAIATRAKYKGNRDTQKRPTHYKAIGEHIQAKWNGKVAVGHEADDELGIGMTANPDSVCVSFDKDLLQIPGLHYDWVKKEERRVTERQGAMSFWQQALSGDPVDNIPGLPGVGPVKAKKILASAKSNKDCWKAVSTSYTDEFGPIHGPEYALETARLVWVRREHNQLWEAPK